MDKVRILAADDHPEIREVLQVLLSSEGYEVIEAADGMEALALVSEDLDLIILDVMMPGLSGLKTCAQIRTVSNVPILFLTAKAQDGDKSLGLLMGGDDYLAKPFSHAELTARVKALLRRYRVYKGKPATEEDPYLTVGDLRLHRQRNEAYRGNIEINLSEIEYRMIRLLTEQPRRIFSVQQIYEHVWNEPYFYSSNGTVMVHIRKLRIKLEEDPQNPKRIVTVWGKGYRLV